MTSARILIVDDEPDMLDNCARILTETDVMRAFVWLAGGAGAVGPAPRR